MEFSLNNLEKSTGVYRCPDEINYFKIRIKIVEQTPKQNGNPNKYVEKEFSWQKKYFSKTQKEIYREDRNYYTELERGYHEEICKLMESHDDDDGFLFSYVDKEEFRPENEMTDKMNYLENAMDNLELGFCTDGNEYNFMASLQKSMENPLLKNNVEHMFLMVDFGEFFEDTWIKKEKVLCTIKFNSDLKVLSVFPDFTTTHPYTLKIQNEEERVFNYFIENNSKSIPESIEVNEKTLIKKINDYKTSLKSQILADSFKLPPKNKLYVFLFLEISSGKNFEYPDVYVQYFIDLPEHWSTLDPKRLRGRTQISRAVKENNLLHFGHCVEVLLEYSFLHTQNTDEFPKSPYIYFEVVSKDSWERHRTEGLCYKCLPIYSSGTFECLLNCFRLTTKNPYSEMRRFFIGDCQNYNDVTWTGLPNDHEDNVLNKYGTETTSRGELNIKLSVVHQSHNMLEDSDGTDSRYRHERKILEKLSSSSLIQSVEQVIREFKKARKQMLEARKNI